jgi:heat-inducible transcriptional repressor
MDLRRQKILEAIIESFIQHALPVGSKHLTESYNFKVSSATIRNEMAALEKEGYITQPHTSAGRIPTNRA